MRIGRLFAISMLSVTALAVILGAEVLVPQYHTVASKTEAIKAVEAFGAVLAPSVLALLNSSVSVGPGATAFTRMPRWPTSLQKLRVMASTAALVAQ